jgi:hypothetical protein
MKNFTQFWIVLIGIIGLSACSNDDVTNDRLPPATTTGANTAGCYIDGKLLIPKNGTTGWTGTPYGLHYVYGNNFWPDKNDFWQLHISNNSNEGNTFGVVLYIRNMLNGNGDYIIGQSNEDLYSDGPDNNQIIAGINTNGVNKTYYSFDNSGVITITRSDLDYGISIYSGTFYCTLYNKDNPSETIEITEGRFDINSLTLNQ